MAKKCDIIIVIPFFNEENRLPEILGSIENSAINKYKVHMVMVNHRSTDNSVSTVNKYADKFYKLDIIEENYPIHCGGQPRSTGIKEAIRLAEKYYQDDSIPVATLDADVIVSKNFIPEIINKLGEGFDVVSFCERYNSRELFNFIEKQINQDSCTRSFVGMNWMRYQVLWGLINIEIKETRGPGGYAMKAGTLKKLNHKQPFDKDGKPITGENNRLGILASRKKLKVYSSPYFSQVHPRREIRSCTNINQKGYEKYRENAEVFKLAREQVDYPILTGEQVENYLTNGIKRTVRMVVIRAVAYQKLNKIKGWFGQPVWRKIIRLAQQYVSRMKPSPKVLEVIGNGFYNEMFESIDEKIGKDKWESLITYLEKKIPKTKKLKNWANDSSFIIKPDRGFISND